jgi:hypothetical protein
MQLPPQPRLPPPLHFLGLPLLALALLHVFGLELGKMVLLVIALILSLEAVGLPVLFYDFSTLPNMHFQLLMLEVSLLHLSLALTLPMVLSTLLFVSAVLLQI